MLVKKNFLLYKRTKKIFVIKTKYLARNLQAKKNMEELEENTEIFSFAVDTFLHSCAFFFGLK